MQCLAVSGNKTASVLVDGGMHGREWVTVATSLQVVGQLREPLLWELSLLA